MFIFFFQCTEGYNTQFRFQRCQEIDIFKDQHLNYYLPLHLGLTDVANQIMQSVTNLKTEVQDGLLKELCQLLMNKAMPSKLDPPTPPPVPSGPIVVTSPTLTILALSTLGRFDFQRHSLQMFINYVAKVCHKLLKEMSQIYLFIAYLRQTLSLLN